MKTVLLSFFLTLVALTFFLVPNNSAYAHGGARSPANQHNKSVLKIHSSQQAAQLVKNRFGGKVLKVNKQKVNGHSGYRVKLLKNNGHVVSVLVDAQSGRIVGR